MYLQIRNIPTPRFFNEKKPVQIMPTNIMFTESQFIYFWLDQDDIKDGCQMSWHCSMMISYNFRSWIAILLISIRSSSEYHLRRFHILMNDSVPGSQIFTISKRICSVCSIPIRLPPRTNNTLITFCNSRMLLVQE